MRLQAISGEGWWMRCSRGKRLHADEHLGYFEHSDRMQCSPLLSWLGLSRSAWFGRHSGLRCHPAEWESTLLLFSQSICSRFSRVRQTNNPPNKTPEPTTTAGTPRAILPTMTCSNRTVQSTPARGAPAVVVAHL